LSALARLACVTLALGLALGPESLSAAGGTSGGDALLMRLGARAMGMGGAYSALGDDPGVMLYNPAGLSALRGPTFSFLHFSAIAQVSDDNFAYAQPLSFGTLGANLVVRSQPDINNPLAQDNPVSAYDVAFTLSYAQKLAYFFDDIPENLRGASFGINPKYLRSHLGRYDADAYAVDLGARYPFDESTTLALSALNLGSQVKFISVSDPLPAELMGGVARRFEPFKGNIFNVAADLEYPFQGDIRIHAGLEDWLGKSLALRAGYVVAQSNDLNGGISAGLSVKLDQDTLVFIFDYAFQPVYYDGFSSFEPQHLISMTLGF
jgi:hypothetical protein